MTGGDGIGTHSKATRMKLSEINKGKTWSEKQKQAQREKMLGHKLGKEGRLKLSENRKGEKNPFYGKKHTEETKARIKKNACPKRGGESPNARKVMQCRP